MSSNCSSSSSSSSVRVGVLALQGAFAEHVSFIRRLGVEAVEIRTPEELEGIDGLIIPGGESTAIANVAKRWNLLDPLRSWVHGGRPVFGTCAGLILIADRVAGQKKDGQDLLGGLNVSVTRNAYGTQAGSFETILEVPALKLYADKRHSDERCRSIFIRAPSIIQVGAGVEVLASLPAESENNSGKSDEIVAVKQGVLLATTFHPELTDDLRWHSLFVDIVKKHKNEKLTSSIQGTEEKKIAHSSSPSS